MKKFKDDFLIGAATAAHQVEGNNKNSDFWVMENIPGSTYKEPSLDAVDHYNKYREDIKILADAGLNSYRFSIEWARIEPSKGNYDSKEIEHYREVLECCHQNEVTPIVTLHHFSSPKWLISEGGWESKKTIKYFGDYTKFVIRELGGLIPYICTINEANMGIQIRKVMERMKKSSSNNSAENTSKNQGEEGDVQVGINFDKKEKMRKYYKVLGEAFAIEPRQVNTFLSPCTENGDKIIMKCHQKAREVIKEINSDIKVGITFSLYDHQALAGGKASVKKEQKEDFLHYLPYLQDDDFLGVQNYSRKVHGPDGIIKPDDTAKLTKMGYEFYPEALAGVLRFVSKYWKKPIIVTENGISTDNDEDRVDFIENALKGVYQCIQAGINVIGYTHWSLLDNFEWQLSYEQKFGLIAVDRSTQKRFPKRSLTYLGNIRKYGF